MSHVMIGDGNNRGMLYHDTVFGYDTYDEICRINDPAAPLIITRGLGFFTDGIVDQHFNARPRMLRTIEACFANVDGARVGFGVSEDTALVYRYSGPQCGPVDDSKVLNDEAASLLYARGTIEVLGSGAVLYHWTPGRLCVRGRAATMVLCSMRYKRAIGIIHLPGK